MSRYRRLLVPGGTAFFTVCLAERGSDLLLREIDLLRWAVGATLRDHPVEVLAWVVLPDHMHAIWRMPEGDSGYARRWGAIKGRFSVALKEARGEEAARSPALPDGAHLRDGESGVWQRRFWEHHIRGPEDLAAHMAFCRTAPVREGLVPRAGDWPYSSFARAEARQAAQSGAGAGSSRPGRAAG
ncbi:REP-associated tyrosine transposase [Sagittula stellata]|uniref:Transposase IS200-like domain-containing protein n=1 Tax=Sagittula stellata (strain ATCC 700073 / DSM 11524 / E-37) TaxID=388399 RepID=A3K5Q4_SAGS3|nr:transposase [Sagittula stellata]EBA07443.1 hypothetical protein SSE37_21630 [Sagittula stellata E-37]